MADGTQIEWTEATWNPITGCSVLSPGCTNCYAMKLAGTRLAHHPSRARLTRDTKAGPVWTGEVRFNEQWLTQPLRWKRPRTIFVCAHGDLFHESVPDAWIDRVFAVMALAPQHTFQVLTKRSARMRRYLTSRSRPDTDALFKILHAALPAERAMQGAIDAGFPLPNVWLGVSVEDQARGDERVPDLLATPAVVRWLSCEPLLGPVWPWHELILARANKLAGRPANGEMPGLDWIVCGGESGPGARPMHPDWARSLRDQCAAAGVSFFFKQWGEWAPVNGGAAEGAPAADLMPDGLRVVHPNALTTALAKVGKKRAGRLLDGVLHNGMPAHG